MTDERFDRELSERLGAYESRLPGGDLPGAVRPRSSPRWPVIGAGAVATVATVLAIGVLVDPWRPDVGETVRSPMPSASALDSSTAGAVNWGPLAVVEGSGDMARNEGSLGITDECVVLERGGERALLVWPADQVRWNAGDGTITFTTIHDGAVTLRSGDYLVLGGGGSSTDEDGLDGTAWADSIAWVNRPADSCLGDSRWFVTDVSSIGVPTPTPGPSPVAWIPLPVAETGRSFASLNGVAEWNERLLAAGRSGETRGAVWWSDDGTTWQEARVPDSPPDVAVHVQAPFAVGDRLLAFGTTASPLGSGPIGSVLWASADGMAWTEVPTSPQFEASPLGVIGVRGQTIVAAESHETATGSAFWVTSDGGASWRQAPIEPDGWWAVDGLVHDGTFIAVGQTFGDGSQSVATVWTSPDGLEWDERELGAGRAVRVAQLLDGSLLVLGDDGEAPMGWTSQDGREWAEAAVDLGCCGTAFAVAPSGLVTVQGPEDGSGSVVATSSDGLTWSVTGPLAGEMRDVAWTETFGLVIQGLDPAGRPAVIVGWESN